MTTPRRRRYITRKFLVKRGACNKQLALFDECFPSGRVLVTTEKAEEYANKFSFDWLSSHLTPAQHRIFREIVHTALMTYFKTLNGPAARSAYPTYVKARARAWAEAFLISEQQQPES